MSSTEEHACLVRARSDSESSAKLSGFGTIGIGRAMTYTDDRLNSTEGSGEPATAAAANMAAPPENNVENEAGELLDYNDSSVLEHFHEDALRQASCGWSQVRVLSACALAMAGAQLELAAVPFILPSAEIELCIQPHEKNWLVLISVVGCGLGGVGWGSLGARLGRRRGLLSCLAVNAVFATIAAFMPTYGTFMMARFCSAIGSGGIVPLSVTYMCEMLGYRRAGAAGAAGAGAGAGGALLAALLAHAALPPTGATTLTENKEHFSAWHRYLLLCTLPIIASLISLIWTQESPRYLLDVGREVDAMTVYQTIHSNNQVRICGKKPAQAPTEYCLGEISLPGKRRPPALHHVRHSVKMFWQAFFQLFSSTYRRTTLSYGGVLMFTMALQFYLSSFIPSTIVNMEAAEFSSSTLTVSNHTFEGQHLNWTLENIEYHNVTFKNCVFKDLLMSHVVFDNCTFSDVAMANVKSSNTFFNGCVFVNTTIIDTDMEVGVEFDEWCVFTSTTIRGMKGACASHADLTSRLGGIVTEQKYIGYATLLAVLIIPLPSRFRPNAVVCGCLVLLSPGVWLLRGEVALYLVEAGCRFFTTVAFFSVALAVFHAYPANLRCSAHAVMLGAGYVAGAGARGAAGAAAGAGGGGAPPAGHALLCALLAVAAVFCALAHPNTR